VRPKDPAILVAAHRAAHNKYPENSLAAIRETIRIGADFIEIDTRCTSDGRVILMHDGSVDRTTNGEGKVASMTFKQIRKLRLKGSDKDHIYKVPTFREALQEAKGKIMVDIDMKSAPVSKLVDIVRQMEMGAVEVFGVDPARVEGITGFRRVDALASRFGKTINAHAWSTGITSAASLHLSLASPNTEIFEFKPFDVVVQNELLEYNHQHVLMLVPFPYVA